VDDPPTKKNRLRQVFKKKNGAERDSLKRFRAIRQGPEAGTKFNALDGTSIEGQQRDNHANVGRGGQIELKYPSGATAGCKKNIGGDRAVDRG